MLISSIHRMFKKLTMYKTSIKSSLESVLVSLCWQNKMSQTGASSNRHLFLIVLEVEKFKIKVSADPVSGKSPHFLLYSWPSSHYILMAGQSKQASSCVLSQKVANPIYEGSTLMSLFTYPPPKGPASQYHHIRG